VGGRLAFLRTTAECEDGAPHERAPWLDIDERPSFGVVRRSIDGGLPSLKSR